MEVIDRDEEKTTRETNMPVWRSVDMQEEWFLLIGREDLGDGSDDTEWSIIGYTSDRGEAQKWWNLHQQYRQLYEIRMMNWNVLNGFGLSKEHHPGDYPLSIMRQVCSRPCDLHYDLQQFVVMAMGGSSKCKRKPHSPHYYNQCVGQHYGYTHNSGVWQKYVCTQPGKNEGRKSECLKKDRTDTENLANHHSRTG